MERAGDFTYICLRFTDSKPDRIFIIEGILEGEAFHDLIGLLVEEHDEDTLDPHILVTFRRSGCLSEVDVELPAP